MRLTVELELEGIPECPNAEAMLEDFLGKLVRPWEQGAALSTRSIEMCGFGRVRLVRARRKRV